MTARSQATLVALITAACFLPGEPSGSGRVTFVLDFAQPYRVPLAGAGQPAVKITADGQALSGPNYHLESLDHGVVQVDPTGRGLEGVARGTTSVRVVYETATTAAPDTTFAVQVVVSRVAVNSATLAFTRLADTSRLAATAYDAKDVAVSSVKFIWSSAEPHVASVDTAGLVRAVNEGTAAITAEADSVTGSSSVSVTQVAAAVRMVPKLDTLRTVSRSTQFLAVALDDTNGVIRTAKPHWSSSDEHVARIDTTGVATATGAGTAKIIARVGSSADTAILAVAQVARFVAVSPSFDTLKAIADTARHKALAFDSLNFPIPKPSLMWATGDPTVATVDQTGLVRAVKNGVVLVTASAAGQSAFATVLVRQEVVAARIAEENVTLTGAGATVRLSGTGLDRNGFVVPGATLTWRSSSACVATVDAAGLVTARGGGGTHIIAAPADGARSDTAAVTVSGAPGGAAIAFTSLRGIEAVCEDGAGRTVLIQNGPEYVVGDPAWSPDGTRLAFVRYNGPVPDGDFPPGAELDGIYSLGVYTANSDGSEARLIGSGYYPAWSPDGTKIALTRNGFAMWCPGSNTTSIDVMNADGTNQTVFHSISVQPTNCGDWYGPFAELLHPTWSPDGSTIAFSQYSSECCSLVGIYTRRYGSEARMISSSWYQEAAWSPDGSQIAVAGGGHIRLMTPDGSGATNLQSNTGLRCADGPAWSPDGSRIVFTDACSAYGYGDLYVIGRDGTVLQRLTSTHDARTPAWRPVPASP